MLVSVATANAGALTPELLGKPRQHLLGGHVLWPAYLSRLDADGSILEDGDVHLVHHHLPILSLMVLPSVDWRAHLGGAVTGAVLAWALTTGRGQQGHERRAQQAIAVLLVVALLVLVIVWRTQQLEHLIVL